MKETNYWQQFMSTGSIDAYLNYRTACDGKEENSDRVSASVRNLGENSYAGVCNRYRDDFKDGACR